MVEQEKSGVVLPFVATAKHPIRKPFVPLTGNPENGDYADWHNCLDNNELISFASLEPPPK